MSNTCQLHRDEIPQPRQAQHRINPNYKTMTGLSMDMKVMPTSYKGHNFILVVIDEVPNIMVMIPIYQSRSEEIINVLIEHVFSKYSIPECMIRDQDGAFMYTLIGYVFKMLAIKIKTIALYNHQSLQAEHGI